MSRLIDADALIEFIDIGHLRNPLQSCFSERDVVDMLESRPTIDAVPVVRCGNCKHFKEPFCTRKGYEINMLTVDFCSYGEPKEGAD